MANITQEERADVDLQLKQLGMVSLVYHVQDLIDIIVAPEIPSTNPSKNYASIYLKNYLMQTLGSKD